MKNIMRCALVTGLLASAVSGAIAQSTSVEQRANFALKGLIQIPSGAISVRVINKDILAALNESGAYHFGPKATLLFFSSDDQPPAIIVRDVSGQQTTNTDVSDYFGVTEIGSEVRSRNQSKQWETWNFAFDNGITNETAFQLWGSTIVHRGAIHTPGVGTIEGPRRVQSKVAGVGRLRGAITIFSGTISGANASLVRADP